MKSDEQILEDFSLLAKKFIPAERHDEFMSLIAGNKFRWAYSLFVEHGGHPKRLNDDQNEIAESFWWAYAN